MNSQRTVFGTQPWSVPSEPCRAWSSNVASASLLRRSGVSSLLWGACHNWLVNRTCYGSADRAVISFFARSALPQQAGYRHRYAASM